jgi:hypothetical protein
VSAGGARSTSAGTRPGWNNERAARVSIVAALAKRTVGLPPSSHGAASWKPRPARIGAVIAAAPNSEANQIKRNLNEDVSARSVAEPVADAAICNRQPREGATIRNPANRSATMAPLYDVDWINGRAIEVFYADDELTRAFGGSPGWY